VNSTLGKALRIESLSRPRDGRYVLVPLDHSVADGPIADWAPFVRLVRAVTRAGADGIIVHKGRARSLSADDLGGASLLVHLSASTGHGPDPDAKVLVGDLEDVIRLGASAVSLHINMGSETESRQLRDLGAVASRCERYGVPLLAMMYPRGRTIPNPRDAKMLAHAANLAADLGADIVKIPQAETAAEMRDVVRSSPIPVVVAGGVPAGDDAALHAAVRGLIQAGCSGLAAGRTVFTAADPGAVAALLADAVHGGASEHAASAVGAAQASTAQLPVGAGAR
jgi:2-amino-4,5-dihydroxy-6-oxo-7-(phosphooxy)heptanoate synthase